LVVFSTEHLLKQKDPGAGVGAFLECSAWESNLRSNLNLTPPHSEVNRADSVVRRVEDSNL